jgi:peptidoglycan/xylan/chitin deacetylase (PgdA/CDA1 family)
MPNINHREQRIATPSYHYVSNESQPGLNIKPDIFHQQMVFLLENGYTFLTCKEAVRKSLDGVLPDKTAVVSFDDGLRTQFDNAFPVLQELGIPATFFIISCTLENRVPPVVGLQVLIQELGASRLRAEILPPKLARAHALLLNEEYHHFHDTLKGPEPKEMRAVKTVMNHVVHPEVAAGILNDIFRDHLGEGAEQALVGERFMNQRSLETLEENGHEVAAHTHIHPDLSMLSLTQLSQQLETSTDVLKHHIGLIPESFAYTYGGVFSVEIQQAVAEIYMSAWNFITTQEIPESLLDPANISKNRYNIPRADAQQQFDQLGELL